MVGMSDIEKLLRKIRKFRDERDWKQFHNAKGLAITLALEAAEVMEHFQWKNYEEVEEHMRRHKDEVAEELADVIYNVLLMCDTFGIDIMKASDRKLKKNEKKYPVKKSKGRHTKYNKL